MQNTNLLNPDPTDPNVQVVGDDVLLQNLSPSGNSIPNAGPNTNAVPPPLTQGGPIDLTKFTQQQIDIMLKVASAFPQPRGEARGNHEPQDEEERSEAHSQPHPQKSTASHLGPSQNTNHKNHGGQQHRPSTWKENRRIRDLKKELEAKQAEYEKARARLEGRRTETPEVRNDTGSVNPSNADMLNTLMALKKRLEDGTSGEVGESPFSKRLEDEPKQRHIKHLNLNPFDGMGDPEEHLSYFNQLA